MSNSTGRSITNPYAKKKDVTNTIISTQPIRTVMTAATSSAPTGAPAPPLSSRVMGGLQMHQLARRRGQLGREGAVTSNTDTNSKSTAISRTTVVTTFSQVFSEEGASSSILSSSSPTTSTRTTRTPRSTIRPPERSVGGNNGEMINQQQQLLEEQWGGQTDTTSTTTTDNSNNTTMLTDRDSHVLLQQPHVLYISNRQRGNGLIPYIRNVPYLFAPMIPDYIMSTTRCALFLSCRYHSLYPNYIYTRSMELKNDFTLRILLVLIDIPDYINIILVLNQFAIVHSMTLILVWSEEEAARYLETYKVMDGKDATLIQKKEKLFLGDQVIDFLTTCPSINKTDASELFHQFGTMKTLCSSRTTIDQLAVITGMGPIKVKRLYDAFHEPFSKLKSIQRKKKKTTY